MLAMIDMEMGNLQSVVEAFKRAGAEVYVTQQAQDIEAASAVILPGVGAFGDGMQSLRQHGLVQPLRRHALEKQKPLLGICVGMQLLAEESEEHGIHQGLGLIPGRVIRLHPTELGCRVPNMGWCDVAVTKPNALFGQSSAVESFYFAHSYHLQCTDAADVAATIEYGGSVAAAVQRGNIIGIQFHAEKSLGAGLCVLAAFLTHLQQTDHI